MTYAKSRLLVLQHLPHEGAGNILDWADANDYEAETLLVPEMTERFPATNAFDCLVILGGVMGVYEEAQYPWMKTEKAFIREAIEADKTVIGICLGSQLLAEALGARVYPHTQKEIGFFPVYKTEAAKADTALAILPDTWPVFHWHGDTFDLPAGATPLFYSDACPNQAYRKDKCWGFQFHPEVNNELLNDMIEFERDELVPAPFVQAEAKIRTGFANYNSTFFHQLLDCMIR